MPGLPARTRIRRADDDTDTREEIDYRSRTSVLRWLQHADLVAVWVRQDVPPPPALDDWLGRQYHTADRLHA